MPPVKNIVILISGRGSNMEAMVRTAHIERWAETLNARIAAVISNRPQAAGLAIARDAGIATQVVDHRAYADRTTFDAELADVIDTYQPDLVVLAGFMRVLTADFVAHYERRLLNIHPSLLPSFGGLHTHQRALSAGVKIHGTTVHFVTTDLDDGPVVIQAAVPVLPTDDEPTLAARVLRQEHVIYPRAVRWFIQGKLSLDSTGRVLQIDGEPQWLMHGE